MEDKATHVSGGSSRVDGENNSHATAIETSSASSVSNLAVNVGVPSLLDSRTLPPVIESVDETAPRYLPREDGSAASTLTFRDAFAQLRKTSSYVLPPPEKSQDDKAPVRDAAAIVYVNRRQQGNPMLKAVRNVGLEFRDGLISDYVIGESSCCILFLSVRYHLLHNSYLEERVQSVRKDDPTHYKTKLVLCFVDVDDNEVALREINRVALLSGFTLVLAWSWLEAARYLETFKAYENKSATIIKEKVEAEFLPKANDVLTSIRSVNKTDVVTLLSTFGTVKGLMNASMEELSLCPGVGAKKVRQLLETFQEPFTKQ
ncbi:hypothetical protein KXD40_003388 [Peronospora effusa]|uniref:DNA excision repair protein ERCC-1 n=1 Tax=Peronospora effusa TaxID=542832 RepID=A0A3M6VMH9_9STRA|nr:hypothetical protein DD238_001426 [Peronospora effusa]RQM17735.1 hypothetical protein DD237_001206 [Peronospora effusa]UIZ29832.1 hypothetical protein KXD40_003388 [Peronospora effusa]CAI5702436.1 unnamed protein product [Peronospora effusa]